MTRVPAALLLALAAALLLALAAARGGYWMLSLGPPF